MFDNNDVRQLGINENIQDSTRRDGASFLITEEIRKVTSDLIDPMTGFRDTGYIKLGHVIDHRAIISFLDTKPVYEAHVASYSNGIPVTDASEGSVYCWHMSDLLESSDIQSLITNPLLTNFVSQYFKCYPTFYSTNCMWTKGECNHSTWKRHRDTDDFKFVTVFVYLTDIDESSGPHIYEEGTQNLFGSIDQVSGPEVVLIGKAGDGFITDAWGIHRGGKVESGRERKVLWIRYGLYDNNICRNVDKNISGIKKDVTDFNSYVTRFI